MIALMVEHKPTPEKKRSRQQRRTGVTRQKLLDAARTVFSEKGLDLTTIDDITERADVGKGTFYYHFSTKEGLIKELIKSMLTGMLALINERCADKKELPEVLDSMIGAHIEFFSARWEDFVLYYQGRADLTLQQGYEGIETPFIIYLEGVEALIDNVIKRKLSSITLRRIGCAVAGFVSGYYAFAAIASEGEDVDKALQSLRGALVAGLVRFINEAMPNDGLGDKERVVF